MPWLVLVVLTWGLVHSLLATVKTREWFRQTLGTRLSRLYRLGYNLFAVLSFLPVPVIMVLVPDHRLYLVPLPWSGLMVLGELLALVVIVLGLRQTGTLEFLGLRIADESDKPPRLTTGGLYHYVRHPLYTAGMAFIWLLPFMTVNILAVNISMTVYVIIGATFEERKLQSVFGQEYADYKTDTPMFIPFLKGNKTRRAASGFK